MVFDVPFTVAVAVLMRLPVLLAVGEPAGEERGDGHRWRTPLRAVIGRFFKDDHACRAMSTPRRSKRRDVPSPLLSLPTMCNHSSYYFCSRTTVVNVKIVEKNDKYMFDPATLTIKKGMQVVWTNMSDAPHTVTSDAGAFNTLSNLSENQTFMFTFTTAGTFTYHCNVHPYMKATITVTS